MTTNDHGAAVPGGSPLVRALQFGDSMFPIGGFAFSGGLESAIQKRVVTEAETLLEELTVFGTPAAEMTVRARSWRTASPCR